MCCVMPPLRRRDVDADDLVQQRRLAVIDVAQDGDDRRAALEFFGVGLGLSRLASSASSSVTACLISISTPSSTASNSACSTSSGELMVSICPCVMKTFWTCATGMPAVSQKVRTEQGVRV